MVHVLNDTVDRPRQFTGFIEGTEVAKVPAVLTADQGVLNVFADGGVDVPPGGLIIPERGVIRIDFGIFKG